MNDEVAMREDEAAYLVVGLGATGLSVAGFLAARGRPLRVVDSRADPPGLGALRARWPDLPVSLQSLDARWLDGVAEVVVSPGVPEDTPLLVEARRRQIPVIGDIELFARAVAAPVLAVTGSNGKSTVTTLTAALLRAQGFNAPAGGNLGPPALELLAAADADGYVLELSSFQMENTDSLRPLGAAVLNVSADHLDRHGDIERYAGLKRKLLECAAHAVVNQDDPLVRRMGAGHEAAIPYSTLDRLERGYCVLEADGRHWLARDLEPIMPVDELALGGALAASNALAALALADLFGGDPAAAIGVLRRFRGLPHRYERVADKAGVLYIDDSKATNVGAALAAIGTTPAPVVLIAGGLAKNADFGPLAQAADKLKAAVLIGEAAGDLARVLAGRCAVHHAGDMQTAVEQAAGIAAAGDVVLLSPACASQDMFTDYRERGTAFANAVRGLPE